MQKIKGLATSSGIAIARIHHLKETPNVELKKKGSGISFEKDVLNQAINQAKNELRELALSAEDKIGKTHAAIFNAQETMLDDPMIHEKVQQKIEDKNLSAAYAFNSTMYEMIALLRASDNLYIKERISDLKDITKRVLNIMTERKNDVKLIQKDMILVADELVPSITVHLDKRFIKGIVTKVGSKTSHSAILSRHLGIPSISGIQVETLNEGDLVIVDGDMGDLIIKPDDMMYQTYKEKQRIEQEKQDVFVAKKDRLAHTKDGQRIYIYANIGTQDDLKQALNMGAEGIGLLRTENQYMRTKDFPDESTLVLFYQQIIQSFKDKSVTVRTLDIGGDKDLPYLTQKRESNPFLGNRAIRYSLSYPVLFKTQLRALLRASSERDVSIMFPMIATLEEFQAAKAVLLEAKAELKAESIETSMPKLGMMVEVPSAAWMMEQFAKVVDFVSIGTNDLIQYMFAADRLNDEVSYLYQPYHPVILKTIAYVVKYAKKYDVKVSVCGEMAGQPTQALLLVGLGVDILSMHAHSIPEIKHLLSLVDRNELSKIAEKALDLPSNQAVKELIESYVKKLLV